MFRSRDVAVMQLIWLLEQRCVECREPALWVNECTLELGCSLVYMSSTAGVRLVSLAHGPDLRLDTGGVRLVTCELRLATCDL